MNGPFDRHLLLPAPPKGHSFRLVPPPICVCWLILVERPAARPNLVHTLHTIVLPPIGWCSGFSIFYFLSWKGSNHFFGVFWVRSREKIGPNFQFSSDICCCCELNCNILLYYKSLPTIIGPERGSAFGHAAGERDYLAGDFRGEGATGPHRCTGVSPTEHLWGSEITAAGLRLWVCKNGKVLMLTRGLDL